MFILNENRARTIIFSFSVKISYIKSNYSTAHNFCQKILDNKIKNIGKKSMNQCWKIKKVNQKLKCIILIVKQIILNLKNALPLLK